MDYFFHFVLVSGRQDVPEQINIEKFIQIKLFLYFAECIKNLGIITVNKPLLQMIDSFDPPVYLLAFLVGKGVEHVIRSHVIQTRQSGFENGGNDYFQGRNGIFEE